MKENQNKPCLTCSASQGQFECEIYTKQGHECPIYRKWLENVGLFTFFETEKRPEYKPIKLS